jgi:ZIP family zinc transporter
LPFVGNTEGTWIGGFAFSNRLAVGAGAILQVVYEVGRLILKDSARADAPALSAPNLGGFVGGVAIMYATALLVSV